MPTSGNSEEFTRRMLVRAARVVENANKVVRGAAIVADQAVVVGTPVDTGRARSNWIASIDAPSEDELLGPGFDKSGQAAISSAAKVIAGRKTGDIFLTNNVPYIIPLEEGHSAQAPEGMAKQAVAAAADYVKRTTVKIV